MQVAHGETPAFDESIRRAVHNAANPGLTQVFEAVTQLGSQSVVISVASCAALILSIGISRVYLGVHYPSDVIAGYLVAILWMASVSVAYRRLASMDR